MTVAVNVNIRTKQAEFAGFQNIRTQHRINKFDVVQGMYAGMTVDAWKEMWRRK